MNDDGVKEFLDISKLITLARESSMTRVYKKINLEQREHDEQIKSSQYPQLTREELEEGIKNSKVSIRELEKTIKKIDFDCLMTLTIDELTKLV